jgi:trigger factor
MAKQQAEAAYEKAMIQKAVDNAKFEVPDIMVNDRVDRMIEELSLNLESRKMNLDMYLKYTGSDIAKLREKEKPVALANVKVDLVLDAIAKVENIQVTEQEAVNEMANIAQEHGASIKEVEKIIKENNTVGLLLANVLRRKAAQVIMSNAKGAKKDEKPAEEVKEEKK